MSDHHAHPAAESGTTPRRGLSGRRWVGLALLALGAGSLVISIAVRWSQFHAAITGGVDHRALFLAALAAGVTGVLFALGGLVLVPARGAGATLAGLATGAAVLMLVLVWFTDPGFHGPGGILTVALLGYASDRLGTNDDTAGDSTTGGDTAGAEPEVSPGAAAGS